MYVSCEGFKMKYYEKYKKINNKYFLFYKKYPRNPIFDDIINEDTAWGEFKNFINIIFHEIISLNKSYLNQRSGLSL